MYVQTDRQTGVTLMSQPLSWRGHTYLGRGTGHPRPEPNYFQICSEAFDKIFFKVSPFGCHGNKSSAWNGNLNVELLIKHHSLKGGCTGSSESTLSKCHIVGNNMLLWLNYSLLSHLCLI